jgi:hypothetical protein
MALADEDFDIRKNLTDGSKKATFVGFGGIEYMKEGNPTFVVLKDKIISDCMSFETTANFYLFNAFNEKITQMVESGIMEWVLRQKASKPEESEPVELSLDHLSIWFKLWAGFLLIASVAFVGEVLTQKILSFVRKRCY